MPGKRAGWYSAASATESVVGELRLTGTPYSTSDTAGIVGVLNLDNGVLTPIATGFSSTRGMVFVSDDERDR